MDSKTKTIRLNDLSPKDLKKLDNRCVCCFGHFNVLHPGHLRYLNFAARQGQPLVVILEGDDFLAEHPSGDDYFTEEERANALSYIPEIDFVLITTRNGLSEVVEKVKPKKLILGAEFERYQPPDLTIALAKLDALSGEVIFYSGEKNLVANLLNEAPSEVRNQTSTQKFREACERWSISSTDLKRVVNSFEKTKALVIGDLIVDAFVACDPLGLSSEAPVVVVKEMGSEEYVGGAGIVAAHVSSLGGSCDFISITGDDDVGVKVAKDLKDWNVSSHLVKDKNRPTTYKTRYVVGNQKVFRVSRLAEHDVSLELENILTEKLLEIVPTVDCIFVSDFVYGVITPQILSIIGLLSETHNVPLFGDLQCSSQVGDVSKFKNYKMLFPTEREARIAVADKDNGLEFVAQTLRRVTKSENLLLKLGGNGMIAYQQTTKTKIDRQHFPALNSNPIDVSGAGDCVLASMGLSIASGSSVMQAAAIGTLAASIAVDRLGNLPVEKVALLERIDALVPH